MSANKCMERRRSLVGVTVIHVGEPALLDVGNVRVERHHHLLANVRVAFDEPGLEIFVHPQDVVDYKHLSVAVRARPDTDRGNANRRSNTLRELPGHTLDQLNAKAVALGSQLLVRSGVAARQDFAT